MYVFLGFITIKNRRPQRVTAFYHGERLFVQYYLIYLFWEFVEVVCFLSDIYSIFDSYTAEARLVDSRFHRYDMTHFELFFVFTVEGRLFVQAITQSMADSMREKLTVT